MSLVCKVCCDSLPHIRNEARLTGIIKGMVNVDNYTRWCSIYSSYYNFGKTLKGHVHKYQIHF